MGVRGGNETPRDSTSTRPRGPTGPAVGGAHLVADVAAAGRFRRGLTLALRPARRRVHPAFERNLTLVCWESEPQPKKNVGNLAGCAREWRWGGRTKPTRRSHHHDSDNNNSKHDNDHDDDNFEFTLYHTHAHVHPFSLAYCFPFLRRSPPLESLSSCRTPTGDSGAHRGGDHHAALRLGPYPRTPAQ